MSRIIGLGLTLLKDSKIGNETLGNELIVESFAVDKNIDKEVKIMSFEK